MQTAGGVADVITYNTLAKGYTKACLKASSAFTSRICSRAFGKPEQEWTQFLTNPQCVVRLCPTEELISQAAGGTPNGAALGPLDKGGTGA